MEIMMWEKEFLVAKIFFKLISIERRKQICLRFQVRYVQKVHTQVYTHMHTHTHTFLVRKLVVSIAPD